MPHDTPVESAFATRLCANRIAELTSQIRTTTARTRPTISPLDGQKIADIAVSSVDDVQSAFDSARGAQPVWAKTSLRERRRAVLKLHDFVLEHQDELMDLIQIESGKTRAHAFDESAHVDKAAEGAVGACFSSADQLCVSIERIYVADNINEGFAATFGSLDAPMGGMRQSGPTFLSAKRYAAIMTFALRFLRRTPRA